MSKKALLVVGVQGSGKGTQSINLSEHFAIPHISTGDLLRAEIKEGSPLGLKIKDNLDRGELVPNSVIEEMVGLCLGKDDVSGGFIFDGFPRNRAQAEFFMKIMADKGFDIKVISLEVSDQEAVKRMQLRAREDDTPESIQKRLEIFHDETKPLIEFFEEHPEVEVLHVDGELSIDSVFEQILQKLGE